MAGTGRLSSISNTQVASVQQKTAFRPKRRRVDWGDENVSCMLRSEGKEPAAKIQHRRRDMMRRQKSSRASDCDQRPGVWSAAAHRGHNLTPIVLLFDRMFIYLSSTYAHGACRRTHGATSERESTICAGYAQRSSTTVLYTHFRHFYGTVVSTPPPLLLQCQCQCALLQSNDGQMISFVARARYR